MKKLTVEEVKTIELDILIYFAEFCKKNKLRYFLVYGTLIGAIRHRGFIPWDDDVDVAMPREDYNTLIECFNSQSENKKYRLISPLENKARHSIVKIVDACTIKRECGVSYKEAIGIDIDVFPVDGMPTEDTEYQKWYKKIIGIYEDYYVYNMSITGSPYTKIKIIIKKLLVYIKYCSLNKNKCLLLAKKLHNEYPFEKSEFVGIVECCDNGVNNRAPSLCFAKSTIVEFEGKSFCAPAGYDTILRNIYGDYMKLPPEDKRKYAHSYEAFLCD